MYLLVTISSTGLSQFLVNDSFSDDVLTVYIMRSLKLFNQCLGWY